MNKRLLLLVSAGSVICGGLALFLFPSHLAFALILHLLAVIMAGVVFVFSLSIHSGQFRIKAVLFVLGFAALVPLLGVLFVTGFALLQLFIPAPASEQKFYIGQSAYLTVSGGQPASAEPHESVLKILAGTDPSARRKAILRLRYVEPRRAIPILQRAVQDSDEQVRILAQSQLSKMIGRLEVDIKFLENQLQSNPAFGTRLELAERYHELVFLGISSQETAIIYLERSLGLVQAALQSKTGDPNALLLQLKCQVRLNATSGAQQTICSLESIRYDPAVLLPWKVEVAYLLRDWPAVRDLVQQSTDASDRLLSVSSFWLSPKLT